MIWAAIGAVLVAVPLGRPAAVGAAEIADPQPGQALRGVVLIRGTAQQPAFDHYEASFSYDPIPLPTGLQLKPRRAAQCKTDSWPAATPTRLQTVPTSCVYESSAVTAAHRYSS